MFPQDLEPFGLYGTSAVRRDVRIIIVSTVASKFVSSSASPISPLLLLHRDSIMLAGGPPS